MTFRKSDPRSDLKANPIRFSYIQGTGALPWRIVLPKCTLSPMRDSDRFKLRFGPYLMPMFKYGQVVFCEVRGEVTIVGLTDAKIPWPMGKRGHTKTFVVFAGLADAVRKEANLAVSHWFGLTPQTVTKWRKALDVPPITLGTEALMRDHVTPKRKRAMRKARGPSYRDPERNEKIRQARLGKPRPKRVIAALRKSHIGSKWTPEQRQKVRETRKRKNPRSYDPWTAEEDEMVRTMPILKVAELTGRPHVVVERSRVELGVLGRSGYCTSWSEAEDALLRELGLEAVAVERLASLRFNFRSLGNTANS